MAMKMRLRRASDNTSPARRGGADTTGEARRKKFLDSYGGQTVDRLIAMESDYRSDSLVPAFEEALLRKEAEELSQAELGIPAVEAMECEVDNAGFHLFSLNSSKECAAILPSSLERIGRPIAAKIASDAPAHLGIKGDVTVAKIDAALERLSDEAITGLEKMDKRYYQNEEPIPDKLFEHIRTKKGEIKLR